jgi:hypothetical protein
MFSTGFSFLKPGVAAPAVLSCAVDCFTSNATWSCCPGTFCIEVIAVAGGGGGGGGRFGFGGYGYVTGGGGGGAGGVAYCSINSGLNSTCSVIVGVGGGRGSCNNPGVPGGDSCFGTSVIASGGAGGPVAGNRYSSAGGCCILGGAGGSGSPSGGGSCACSCFNGNGASFSGGSALGKPGGGGAGGAAYAGINQQNVYKTTAPGNGGAGSTFCGLALGCGGIGALTQTSCATNPPPDTAGDGGFPGGGAGGSPGTYNFKDPSCAGIGGAGIVVVTQYYLG